MLQVCLDDSPLFKWIEMQEVTSTNDFLRNMQANGATLNLVTAEHQTAGRGQTGNTWESEAGKNLLCSFMFTPTAAIHPSESFVINQAVAMAVRDACQEFIAEPVTVKWPNDIYVGERKLAGILIETTMTANAISRVIAGIGINVNQTAFAFAPHSGHEATSQAHEPSATPSSHEATSQPHEQSATPSSHEATSQTHEPSAFASGHEATSQAHEQSANPVSHEATSQPHEPSATPVSIKMLTGSDTLVRNVLEQLVGHIRRRLPDKADGYMEHLYRRQGFHPYTDASGTFSARIAAIEPSGRLVLETADGQRRSYAFKEVKTIGYCR